jgi:hypothetical protein
VTYYAAYIAICIVAIAPPDCDKPHATHWVVAPERQDSLSGCFKFGQDYIDRTQLVKPGETYPKVFCEPMVAP